MSHLQSINIHLCKRVPLFAIHAAPLARWERAVAFMQTETCLSSHDLRMA